MTSVCLEFEMLALETHTESKNSHKNDNHPLSPGLCVGKFLTKMIWLGVVVHAFSPCTGEEEAEAGQSLSSRLALSME